MTIVGYSRPAPATTTTDGVSDTERALLNKVRELQHRLAAVTESVVINDLETETELTDTLL